MDFFSSPPLDVEGHGHGQGQCQQMVYSQGMNGVNMNMGYPQPMGMANGYGQNGYVQQQQYGQNVNGNPFSNNMQSHSHNAQQMTFTAASNAERNRLKEMEMRNAVSEQTLSRNENDPFSSKTGGDDPFFAENGNGGGATKQTLNANDDPFAVWGL